MLICSTDMSDDDVAIVFVSLCVRPHPAITWSPYRPILRAVCAHAGAIGRREELKNA